MKTALLILALMGLGDAYRVRYDSPSMDCRFSSLKRSSCVAKNVYPATPQWTVSNGNQIIESSSQDIVFFDMPSSQWVEVDMEVVRWDGALITLELAVIRDANYFYYLPLNSDTHVEGRTPPQWALDLPDYTTYYADRANRLKRN